MNCYKTISAIAFAGLLTFFHTELYAQQSLADTIIHLLRKSHINNKLDSASFNTAREHILTADLTDEQIAQIESAAGGLSEPENHEIRFVIFTNLLNNDADRTISYGQLQIEKFDKLNSPEASNLKFLYLARLRFPFRNTNRLEEGLQYYLRKLNDYLTSNDSLAISQCHFVLGGFYSVSGIIDLAIYHCKKAISYVDTSKRKWTRINHVAVLGSEYLRKGDKTACLQYSGIAYREFLKSKSGYSFSALNIARMMLSSNESDSAAYYIKKAKEDPAVARSYADQCSILQTEALFKIRSGYLDEAEALLNKCWQLIFENNVSSP